MDDQKLYLEFETDSGAKVSIVVPNAKDDIEAENVEDVADDILDSGLFAVQKDGAEDAFASLYSAYYLRTQKTPLQSDDPELKARKGGTR